MKYVCIKNDCYNYYGILCHLPFKIGEICEIENINKSGVIVKKHFFSLNNECPIEERPFTSYFITLEESRNKKINIILK